MLKRFNTNISPVAAVKPLALIIAAALSGHAVAAGTMADLGTIAPGITSNANGSSMDGSVVVGQVQVGGGGDFGFLWTPGGGMQTISLPSTPPTIGGFAATDLYVNGVSANGQVVVGDVEAPLSTFNTQAFRWTQAGGLQVLGYLPGGSSSSAIAANTDGSVIVGSGDDGQAHSRAFRWTASGGMQSLGTLTGYAHSFASGVNSGGNVVVGLVRNGANTDLAFRWTADNGMQAIPLQGGWAQSQAVAVNYDGDAVAGTVLNALGTVSQAFRWSTGEGFQALGTLNGASTSYAVAISGNGAVVVGGAKDGSVTPTFADTGDRAFRWSKATGMQTVETWAGVTLPSPTFSASGTNYDGSVVVGNLQNGHAFIATGSGVLALDSVQTQSLASTAQIQTASSGLAGLVFSGAHGNPLLNRPAPGKQTCFWALGDWGDQVGTNGANAVGLAEVGGCRVIAADTQVNFALGHAWSKQTGDLSSRSELKGTYGTLGLLSRVSGPFWGLAEVLYQRGTADIRRGYLNGGTPTLAAGDADVETTGLRLRAIGENLVQVGGLALSPYLDASKLRTTIDAYSESNTAFPASFASRHEDTTTVRLGAHGILPLGADTRLLAQVEAAHRFEKTGADVRGNIIGAFNFSLGGSPVEQDWQRLGLGVEHNVAGGVLSLVANRTTVDHGANIWVTLGYRTSF